MSEMVERVARALAKQEGYAYDPLPYDERARAAIAAIREPITQKMGLAFARYWHDNYRDDHVLEDTPAEDCWRDMVDAALASEK